MIMPSDPQFGSPTFRVVAARLVDLHRLIRDGKGDLSEAESVHDALDQPLDALSQLEQNRAQWLSEDLYSVSEPLPATVRKAMDPSDQQQHYEAFKLIRVRNWDRALEALRALSDSIAPALLSHLRGTIWNDAGYPEVAAVFFNHAAECEPAN